MWKQLATDRLGELGVEARLDSVFDSNSDDGQSGRVCCNCLNELQRLNKLKGNLESKIMAGIEGLKVWIIRDVPQVARVFHRPQYINPVVSLPCL